MPRKCRKITHSVPEEAVQTRDDENSALVPEEIRRLVCERCWADLFAAPECWVYSNQKYSELPHVSHTVSRSQVLENSKTCNWCSLVSWVSAGGKGEKHTHLYVSLEPLSCDWLPTAANRFSWGMRIDGGTLSERSTDLEWFRPVTHLDVCTSPKDEAAELVAARPVQGDVDTELAYNEIKAWLQACKFHPKCTSQGKVRLPTRVVDVGSRVDSAPRLYRTRGAVGSYAALSYCWGGRQDGALTQHNFHRHLKAFDMNEISQTIRDAIKVVRSIGLRYLWVDALCILQDNELDRTREIATMGQIYSKALFTISAEMASSAKEGFLSPRKPPPYAWKLPLRLEDGTFGSLHLEIPGKGRESLYQPLNTRAWTLQETLLSPRLLIYNSRTLRWWCRSCEFNIGSSICREDDAPYRHLRTARSLHDTSRNHMNDWALVVQEYSRRELSDPKDRLRALSGVAEAFAEILEATYLAGLWEFRLIDQLIWCPESSLCPRPLVYRAPSWSWASVNGPVALAPTGDCLPGAKVLECSTTCESVSALFGDVTGGWLVLEGALLQGRYKSDLATSGFRFITENETHQAHHPTNNVFKKLSWRLCMDSKDEPQEADADFLMLKRRYDDPATDYYDRRNIHGLILRDLQNGNHVRIGTFSFGTGEENIGDIDASLPPVRRVRII